MPVAKENYSKQELSSLIQNNHLFTHFQPIVNITEERIQGFEALTRFPMNDSFKSPIELFQLADSTGSLFQLEKHTRKLAIDRISPYLQSHQQLWVNLTPTVIHDRHFTPGFTHSILEGTNISPEQIVFEITEHSAIKNFSSFKRLLNHYRKQGFKIAIDDVGAGYSSLQTISELKPEYLKVDRSLISDIHVESEKQCMVEALQQIGTKMGAEIVAEGVEKDEECLQLIHMGIELLQGYYFAKPGYPPQSLGSKTTRRLRNKYNESRFPLTIYEETTFEDLVYWISQYQGPVDHRFVIMKSHHTKAVIPLNELYRFMGNHWSEKESEAWPLLLHWMKKTAPSS
ncbi:EAL domain-containing protein [Halobacillus litoralis]|uniref:EAL domain-containing protein n=1 Tax=Halobacillus litoralis TaxID=45668 RepID=UPI001CFED58E|nr:EAL domain-containing protein [Halobacillus litoralis]